MFHHIKTVIQIDNSDIQKNRIPRVMVNSNNQNSTVFVFFVQSRGDAIAL
jgi:hypothetical protein